MSLYAGRLQDVEARNDFVKFIVRIMFILLAAMGWFVSCARGATPEVCPQPPIGSVAEQPAKIESAGGMLRVELRMRSEIDERGSLRYCYVSADGKLAPTLRLNPGDWLVVELKNEITPATAHHDRHMPMAMESAAAKTDSCAGGIMIDGATNLHFHGLAVPPVCHQDEAMRTMISPRAPAFEYRMRIPENTPPGLYWYHPHPHGFTKAQVLGGTKTRIQRNRSGWITLKR
jgi:FtsP/CotA-like multicopper oxidase with cupredoxin domain